jgi:hypothetical protein
MTNDPTYERKLIDATPEWKLAFRISEFENDNAPLGWGRYIPLAMSHIHTYQRKNIGRDKEVWVMKCVDPKCTHYIFMKSKLSAPQLWGKSALCNECGDEFLLNRRALRLSKPTCNNCAGGEIKEKAKEAVDFLSKLGIDI